MRHDVHVSYAVVVSANDGPQRPGGLELGHNELLFSDGTRVRYDDLDDVYLERRAGHEERPALVLISHRGERRTIESLEGLGALHELADGIVKGRSHDN